MFLVSTEFVTTGLPQSLEIHHPCLRLLGSDNRRRELYLKSYCARESTSRKQPNQNIIVAPKGLSAAFFPLYSKQSALGRFPSTSVFVHNEVIDTKRARAVSRSHDVIPIFTRWRGFCILPVGRSLIFLSLSLLCARLSL